MECSVDDNVCVNGVRSKSPVSVLYANNKQKDTNNGKGEHISKNQFDNNRDARANKAIRTFFRRNAPSFSCRSMFGRGKKNELFAKLARLMKIKCKQFFDFFKLILLNYWVKLLNEIATI